MAPAELVERGCIEVIVTTFSPRRCDRIACAGIERRSRGSVALLAGTHRIPGLVSLGTSTPTCPRGECTKRPMDADGRDRTRRWCSMSDGQRASFGSFLFTSPAASNRTRRRASAAHPPWPLPRCGQLVSAWCGAGDHAAVLKVWSKRHRDLGRTLNQVVCRLRAVLGELIPGGVPKAITTAAAGRGGGRGPLRTGGGLAR
jgi:hypothetical protein